MLILQAWEPKCSEKKKAARVGSDNAVVSLESAEKMQKG